MFLTTGFLHVFAQNVEIRGKADPAHVGKIITLYSSIDHITELRQKEYEDTVQADGYFELAMHADYTQPVFLKIDNLVGTLFVQPDFVYGVTFPEADRDKMVNKDVDLPVNIGIIGNDSTELNALIFDYEAQYNKTFAKADERFLSRAVMFKLSDSLQRLCDKRYAGVKNEYFKTHVRYSIASLNASLSRGEEYLMSKYITGKPIQYHHQGYMAFFNATFKGYLSAIASRRKGQSIYNIINSRADYPALLNFVRYEKNLKSDSLRELIIIRELWDFYFSADFAPDAIENILAQLNLETKIQEHKKITATMLAYINKLQVGSPAPVFSALGRDGKTFSLSAFKGRWVYLNFFSTQNVESLKEMPKIAMLKKKYNDKLIFLSVCLDDSISTYKNYLKANPRFDWNICYANPKLIKPGAKELYYVTGNEAYFLIDNFGSLAASPALKPSKGIEYRLNVIFKVKQRSTKTGIR